MDCKLFSQSDCRKLLYFPRPSHLWYNAHCTRNIVTHQLQYCFVNYFHDIFGTMVQFFYSVVQCALFKSVLYRTNSNSYTCKGVVPTRLNQVCTFCAISGGRRGGGGGAFKGTSQRPLKRGAAGGSRQRAQVASKIDF